MNTRRLTVGAGTLALMAASSVPAWSQAEIVRPSPVFVSASQGLTTHGHGEIKVKPDIARLTAEIMTHDKHQAQAVQDNARQMTALTAAVKGLAVADKDIQTQGYTVSPQYDYSSGRSHLTGYQVTNSVQVTVRDLTQVGALIDAVTQAGVSQLDGVSYDLSDPAATQKRALSFAVTDAKQRAEAMASALGVSLGDPLSLNDGAVSPVQPFPLAFAPRVQAFMGVGAAPPVTPIAAQDITVTADVTLVYTMGAAK